MQDQLFRTAKRLQKAVAIRSVVTWRVVVPTMPGGEVPESAAEVLIAGEEPESAGARAEQRGRLGPSDPGSAAALAARLGG